MLFYKMFVQCLNWSIENGIELACLPAHTAPALPPLDRAFFKPLKTWYHQQATISIQNHSNTSIKKLSFGKLLAAAWSKEATATNTNKGFQSTQYYFNQILLSYQKTNSCPLYIAKARVRRGKLNKFNDSLCKKRKHEHREQSSLVFQIRRLHSTWFSNRQKINILLSTKQKEREMELSHQFWWELWRRCAKRRLKVKKENRTKIKQYDLKINKIK